MAAAPAAATAAATAEPATSESPAIRGDLEAAAAIPRRVPVPVLQPPLDRCAATGVSLGAGDRVAVMPDSGGVARALVKRLAERGVEVVELDPADDADALRARLDRALAGGSLRGVYWLPALDDAGDLDALDLSAWRNALRVRVKLLYVTMRHLYDAISAPGSFLVSATRLGGLHGYGEDGATAPLGGAVTGFTKSFARERPEALVKAVDFPASRKTAALADALIEETLADPGTVELGLQGGERFGVGLREQPADDGSPGLPLGAETVFVVTGAAGGIVSAIVADLAEASGGRFHLLDIVPEPDESDPELVLFLADREAVKRKVFERLKAAGERGTPVQVERELGRLERAAAALSAMRSVRAAGGRARWHAVDLKDGDGVRRVVEAIRAEDGAVDVVLHAAGLERSRALPDKSPEEFDLVFDVKSDGWFNLLGALVSTPPRAVVGFSSIAGRFGNAGQADYSAANDLLCKSVSSLRRWLPQTRGIAIDWTAWGDLGMATRGSIPEVMARAGIDMLPAVAGIPIVRRELTAGGGCGEVLVAGRLGVMEAERHPRGGLAEGGAVRGPLVRTIDAAGPQGGLRARVELDPSAEPFLDHHRIEGTPVLPGVMGLEAFAELTADWVGGRTLEAIEDVRFLAPFKFYRDEPRALELAARLERAADRIVAHCSLVGRRRLAGRDEEQVTTHFAARLCFGHAAWSPPEAPVPGAPPDTAASAADVYRVYFHGPAFQVLDAAWREGDGAVGRLAEGLPALCAAGDAGLVAAPRLVELCFQAAGIWEIGTRGRMGLPQHIVRVRIAPDAGADGARFAVVSPRADGASDVAVLDASGRVRLQLEGYATALLPDPLAEADAAPIRRAMGT